MTSARISAATQVVGVIGAPVAHSRSPLLHNAAFSALGLDWVSLGFPVADGNAVAAVRGALALGVRGLSVTMPHKEAVLHAVDSCRPQAARLEAANCLIMDGGHVVGENTDGGGFVDALSYEHQWSPAGRRCLVVGAGGAARAVVAALADAGASLVVVVNRSLPRAEQAALLAGAVGRVGDASDVASSDLVVNATPLGMHGVDGGEAWPLDPALLAPSQLVFDLIYSPLETPWLAAARERGCDTSNGLGMLVHQAARQLALWTGHEVPVEAMWAALGEVGA